MPDTAAGEEVTVAEEEAAMADTVEEEDIDGVITAEDAEDQEDTVEEEEEEAATVAVTVAAVAAVTNGLR